MAKAEAKDLVPSVDARRIARALERAGARPDEVEAALKALGKD